MNVGGTGDGQRTADDCHTVRHLVLAEFSGELTGHIIIALPPQEGGVLSKEDLLAVVRANLPDLPLNDVLPIARQAVRLAVGKCGLYYAEGKNPHGYLPINQQDGSVRWVRNSDYAKKLCLKAGSPVRDILLGRESSQQEDTHS